MAELVFVGLGLADDRDLSERSLERLRSCGRIFSEAYTSVLAPGSLDRLGRSVGRRIELLTRTEVESERILLEALGNTDRVGFVVAGDPFAATTHVALRLAAERAGHRWSYLPSASIVSAAPGFLGLQQYRFGRIVSLPFLEPGFAPASPLRSIAQNRSRDLHTLVLLDLRPDERRFMSAAEALARLVEPVASGESPAVPADLAVAVAARVGTESAQGWYGTCAELLGRDFGPPLHCVVVPAPTLHFEEEAALASFRIRRPAPGR